MRAPDRGVSHVFLSYARRDQTFVDRLVAALEARGVNVWVDREDIPGGAAWESAIGEALAASSAVLVVLSPACAASEYVPRELSLAEKYDRPIVPILHEPWESEPDAPGVKRIEFQLAGLQYVDFSSQSFEQALDALLRALGGAHGPAVTSPAPAIASRHGTRRGLMLGGVGLVATAVLAALVASRWRNAGSPRIDGDWDATARYSWGVTTAERFRFSVDQGTVSGTASFLGAPRGILDGRLDGSQLTFQTRILGGPESRPFSNGYRGRVEGDAIRFVLQDDRGSPPVEFTAHRAGGG
jgi:hypothetical protein